MSETQDIKKITLHRGANGLGFNIRGGKDQPHVPDDSGIFVTKIRETGAAAQDGTLQEGDKILEINGNNMEDINHTEAVNLFLSAGDEVTLVFWSGAEEILMKKYAETRRERQEDSRETYESGDFIRKYRKVIAIGAAVCVATALAVYFRKDIADGVKNVATKLGLK